MSDDKITAVQNLYAAYQRGDMDGVLADLAEDVDWAAEAPGSGAPWYGSYLGKAEVPAFFRAIVENVDIDRFDIVGLTSSERDVVATVDWRFTVKSTGKSASMYMQHWWRFADGQIVQFRGSEDSAQTIAAFA